MEIGRSLKDSGLSPGNQGWGLSSAGQAAGKVVVIKLRVSWFSINGVVESLEVKSTEVRTVETGVVDGEHIEYLLGD